MAKQIIPERICPHCGGNKWYVYLQKKKYKTFICPCQNRKAVSKYRTTHKEEYSEYNKLYLNSGQLNLKDYVIKTAIQRCIFQQTNVLVSRKTITPEQIEEYRKGILAGRELRQQKQQLKQQTNENSKTIKGNQKQKLQNGKQVLPAIHGEGWWWSNATQWGCKGLQMRYASNSI